MVMTGQVSAQVPNLPGWDLVFNDEFDGTSLNTTNWTALDRKDSFNNEKQYYHPNQVAVSGGNLVITAINVPRQGKAYQSGLITSNNLFGPGRFEARMDLPTTQGMWPAFWLNPNQVQWPTGGEIDILENRGSQPNLVSSAYHWQTNPGPCCDQHQYVYDEYTATEGGQPVNFHNGFHTYAVEWDETVLRFYVDDNLYHTVTETANRPIFETAKNIILNVAVGGDFGGDPNGSTVWPQTMLVDYVRYWQRSTAPVLQGDIDNDGFVGIADLNILLGEWNQSGDTGALLTDFSNFNLTGTYEQWNSGSFTSGANDYRVQANDFGGGWRNLGGAVDATGETTLNVKLDVNPGNVADAFNIVLIDADGTQRVYRYTNLNIGNDQVLSIDLNDFLQDNAVGGVPGLDLANIVTFHLQGTFGNGDPTFDNLSIGTASGIALLGDIDGDGFVGIADLNILLGEWNQGSPPGVLVPEPAAAALLGLGLAATLRRNGRRFK
jgi:beta-glucanase (GH16 family)